VRLTTYELQRLSELKKDFLHTYDEANEGHEAALTDFWMLVFTESERA